MVRTRLAVMAMPLVLLILTACGSEDDGGSGGDSGGSGGFGADPCAVSMEELAEAADQSISGLRVVADGEPEEVDAFDEGLRVCSYPIETAGLHSEVIQLVTFDDEEAVERVQAEVLDAARGETQDRDGIEFTLGGDEAMAEIGGTWYLVNWEEASTAAAQYRASNAARVLENLIPELE